MPTNGQTIGRIKGKRKAVKELLEVTAGTPTVKVANGKTRAKKPHEMTATEYKAWHDAKMESDFQAEQAKKKAAKAAAEAAKPGIFKRAAGAVKKGVKAAKKKVEAVKALSKMSPKEYQQHKNAEEARKRGGGSSVVRRGEY